MLLWLQLDDIFAIKAERKTAKNAFLGKRLCFALPPAGFGKSLEKHRGAQRLATAR